jgi:hypothetical protein
VKTSNGSFRIHQSPQRHWGVSSSEPDSLASECLLFQILCSEAFDTTHSLACILEMFVIPACVVIMRYIRERLHLSILNALVTDIEM